MQRTPDGGLPSHLAVLLNILANRQASSECDRFSATHRAQGVWCSPHKPNSARSGCLLQGFH